MSDRKVVVAAGIVELLRSTEGRWFADPRGVIHLCVEKSVEVHQESLEGIPSFFIEIDPSSEVKELQEEVVRLTRLLRAGGEVEIWVQEAD